MKILGFLGAVILGYAYVYSNLSYRVDEFSLVTIASNILLAFGAALVTVIAYSFRRDQAINARIRAKAGVIGENKPFPIAYDPTMIFKTYRKCYFWMPDIFNVFYLLFPVFQILLISSFYAKIKALKYCTRYGDYIFFTEILSSIAILISLIMPVIFFVKLKNKIATW